MTLLADLASAVGHLLGFLLPESTLLRWGFGIAMWMLLPPGLFSNAKRALCDYWMSGYGFLCLTSGLLVDNFPDILRKAQDFRKFDPETLHPKLAIELVVRHQSKFPVLLRATIAEAAAAHRTSPSEFHETIRAALRRYLNCFPNAEGNPTGGTSQMDHDADTQEQVEFAIRMYPTVLTYRPPDKRLTDFCMFMGHWDELKAIPFFPLIAKLAGKFIPEGRELSTRRRGGSFRLSMIYDERKRYMQDLEEDCLHSMEDLVKNQPRGLLRRVGGYGSSALLRLPDFKPEPSPTFGDDVAEASFLFLQHVIQHDTLSRYYRRLLASAMVKSIGRHHPIEKVERNLRFLLNSDPSILFGTSLYPDARQFLDHPDDKANRWKKFQLIFELQMKHHPGNVGFLFYETTFCDGPSLGKLWFEVDVKIPSNYEVACENFGNDAVSGVVDPVLAAVQPHLLQRMLVKTAVRKQLDGVYYLLRHHPSTICG